MINGESPEMKLKLVSRIQVGELAVEQVPEFYREAVKQVLDEQSNLG